MRFSFEDEEVVGGAPPAVGGGGVGGGSPGARPARNRQTRRNDSTLDFCVMLSGTSAPDASGTCTAPMAVSQSTRDTIAIPRMRVGLPTAASTLVQSGTTGLGAAESTTPDQSAALAIDPIALSSVGVGSSPTTPTPGAPTGSAEDMSPSWTFAQRLEVLVSRIRPLLCHHTFEEHWTLNSLRQRFRIWCSLGGGLASSRCSGLLAEPNPNRCTRESTAPGQNDGRNRAVNRECRLHNQSFRQAIHLRRSHNQRRRVQVNCRGEHLAKHPPTCWPDKKGPGGEMHPT